MIKRFHSLGYLAAYILPISVVIGYYLGSWFNFSTIVLVFVIIPAIDQWNGTDNRILGNERVEKLAKAGVHQFILLAYVPIQLALLIWAAFVFPTLDTILWQIGFTLGVGLSTGAIGITVAHELGHKKSNLERNASKFLLMMVYYMHFFIEHNKGHHVNVGTDEDPASAKRSEGFYRFYIRTVFGSYFHAWRLEKERLMRRGHSLWRNKVLGYSIYPWILFFSILAIVYISTGTWYWVLLVFFIVQSIIAFTLLELVNYVEHYGLRRKMLENGRYEPVSEQHSWNSSHAISNYFLFQLQLHSDHHMNAIKKYQSLQHVSNSPQLPAGYPMMILAALVPPLWFRVVHPILGSWEAS